MEEFVTKKKIKKYLDEIGIDYIEFKHHRGIMAYIYKENAKTTIGIRGDIDALPIQEVKESEYKSQNDGVMHACGHDAHTTMLIGACRLLYEIRDKLNVNIKFFFEPAEEKDGGAKFFVEDGLMENPKVEYMFGAHVQGYLDTKVIESKYDDIEDSIMWNVEAYANVFDESGNLINKEKGDINILFSKENGVYRVSEYSIERKEKN